MFAGMQNSASSCNIVSLMCLFTAAITGTFGVINKQVTAGMVTGVMYVVSGQYIYLITPTSYIQVDVKQQLSKLWM